MWWWGPGAGTAVGREATCQEGEGWARHLGQVSTRASSSEPRGGARALGGVRSPDPRPQPSSLKGASAGRERGLGAGHPWGQERAASGRDPSTGAPGRPAPDKHTFHPLQGLSPFFTQLERGWKPAPKMGPGSLLTAPPSLKLSRGQKQRPAPQGSCSSTLKGGHGLQTGGSPCGRKEATRTG